MTPEHEQQHCESSANSLAAYLAALRGDRAGLAVLLDGMTPLELRRIATMALHASADMTVRGSSPPSQGELDGMIAILETEVATLRMQAMGTG